jgi:flagellar basal-body rod protein FlgF
VRLANGIWTAASGAAVQAQNLEIVANNLANTDTLAFKKDVPTFKEYMASVERTHDGVDIPRGPIQDKDFYPLEGRDQSHVVMDGTHTQFRQGHLRVTQRPLDVALEGPGFLEVSTPNGVRYTRQGSLKLSPQGMLVTQEGYPVLSSQPSGLARLSAQGSIAGNAPEARTIQLQDVRGQLSINDQGEMYSGENLISRLSVVEFANLQGLRKTGGQLFEALPPSKGNPARNTMIHQGVVETSNVNPIEEMTQMIKANRLFEHDLKALKTYGELLGKEVNEVGKL